MFSLIIPVKEMCWSADALVMKSLNLKYYLLTIPKILPLLSKIHMKTEPYMYGFSIGYIIWEYGYLQKAIKMIIMAILVQNRVACVIFSLNK